MRNLAILIVVGVALASALTEGEDETALQVEEAPRSCLELGEVCSGEDNHCQCCRSNGFCSCSWIFNHCTCKVGDSSKSYGVCMWKQKNCPNKPGKCTKPCTHRRCKNRG